MVFELILWAFTVIIALRITLFLGEIVIVTLYHKLKNLFHGIKVAPRDEYKGVFVDVLV